MAREGLMDDSGYKFFDVSDCVNYENCREEAYNQGKAEMQEFVENRCKELGIDYIAIFTCNSIN